MKTVIFICGLYSVAFAIFHIFFWKLFHWKKELSRLSFANKAIVQILNTRIIYFFLFVAFICFTYPDELTNTNLGKAFLAGTSVFWLGRTIEQFIFLKVSNRYVHVLTIILIAGAVLFALPLVIRK